MDPIHVTKATLQAALAHASSDVTRYNINAVAFEKSGRMIATDGHRLVVIDSGGEKPIDEGAGEPPIALEAAGLTAAMRGLASKDVGILTFEDDHATLTNGTNWNRIPVVAGEYPNWRQVMPKGKNSADSWGVNPKYLADTATAAKRLGVSPLRISCKGEHSPVLMEGENTDTGLHFRGVVMPVRLKG